MSSIDEVWLSLYKENLLLLFICNFFKQFFFLVAISLPIFYRFWKVVLKRPTKRRGEWGRDEVKGGIEKKIRSKSWWGGYSYNFRSGSMWNVDDTRTESMRLKFIVYLRMISFIVIMPPKEEALLFTGRLYHFIQFLLKLDHHYEFIVVVFL